MDQNNWLVLLMLGLLAATGTGSEHQPSPTGGSGDENQFLKYIFNKYGSKGVISFEGLEHLMHNLGLGGLDFSPSHTLDEHRPDGFKTADIIAPYTADYSEIDSVSNKATVSFNSIDDVNAWTSMADVITTASPERNKREESHYHHAQQETDSIDSSSNRIRKFNELSEVNEANDTATDNGHDGNVSSLDRDEGDSVSNDKWHNDIWQETIFKEIHDPLHRHPRQDDRRKSCLSPMTMVQLILEEPMNSDELWHRHLKYDLSLDVRQRRSLPHAQFHGQDVEAIMASRIKITPSSFRDLCPALLAQIDQRACHAECREKHQPHVTMNLFRYEWVYAFVCVFIISICGLIGVAIVPLAKSVAYDGILRFLVALAIGTLCGDALMHLLPHALIPHESRSDDHDSHNGNHEHSNEPVWLCCCAFLSALFMYTLETVLPMLRSEEDTGHHGHSHSIARVAPIPETKQTRRNTNVADDIEMDLQDNRHKELNTMLEKKPTRSKPLSPVAFLVMLGDGLHNITDGLAIGAAFASDPVTGMATSLAILCHELPHELGDFALLLQTGVSIRRAMFLNVVSSILSFIGMLIGLLVTGLHESVVRWIYAGTAGTFLYIALADLIPEMNRSATEKVSSEQQRGKRLWPVLSQICGIFLGGIIMLLIALNENRLRLLFE